MATPIQSSGNELELNRIQFSRDQEGDLIRVPGSPDLEGYLVFIPTENIYAQVRLLKTTDGEKRKAFRTVAQRVLRSNDSVICPEIFAEGQGESSLFYVSSLPRGEQVTQFVKRNGPIPPPHAVGLVLRFLKALRAQNPALYEEFAMAPESIWIARTSGHPRIMLGEFSPVIDPQPEQRNVVICLELLRYLSGEAPFDGAFQELCGAIESDRQELSVMIKHLEVFAKAHPATEFWTKKTRPVSLLQELAARATATDNDSAGKSSPEKEVKRFGLPVLLPTGFLILLLSGIMIGLKGRSHFNSDSALAGRESGGGPSLEQNRETDPKQAGQVVPRSRAPLVSTPQTHQTQASAVLPAQLSQEEVEEVGEAKIIENLAKAARDDDDLFRAIKNEATLHRFKPDWKEPVVRLRDDLANLQLKASRSFTGEEISILENVSLIDSRAFDILITNYRDQGNLKAVLKTLVDYGSQGHPDKLREAGKQVLGDPSATAAAKTKARSWLVKAAEQGDREAQFYAGECLILGKGGKKDLPAGADFLRAAADQGEARAMDLLGVCYGRGWGVPRDETRAVALLKEAVGLGNISACYNLGARYAQGQGVPRNPDKAADLFERGSIAGDAGSMFLYARCFENGYGREENLEEAIKWFRKSSQKGDLDAIKWCRDHDIEIGDRGKDISPGK